MKYEYPISFLKLPRRLQKIPVECREAFDRKYNPDLRLNLLCRVYRLPDMLKDIFSQVEIMKRKEGYSQMQRFMDDYWEVPLTDRTITPELMHKLKTVPATYFPIEK